MCGRFVSVSSTELLAARFHVDDVAAERPPSHNVAPSQDVRAIVEHEGRRRLGLLRWGYVPSWSKDPTRGIRPINARAEGALTSAMFRSAIGRRRCVVPMDGWYEWQQREGAGPKRAFHHALSRPGPFAVAALRSVWRADPDAEPLHSVALITTAAVGAAATVHDRMPLVVPDDRLDDWLDPGIEDPAAVLAAILSAPPEVVVHEVSTRVNRVGNDGPELVTPLGSTGGTVGGGASGGAGR